MFTLSVHPELSIKMLNGRLNVFPVNNYHRHVSTFKHEVRTFAFFPSLFCFLSKKFIDIEVDKNNSLEVIVKSLVLYLSFFISLAMD